MCIKFDRIITINGIKATTEDIIRLLDDLKVGKVKVVYYDGKNVVTD